MVGASRKAVSIRSSQVSAPEFLCADFLAQQLHKINSASLGFIQGQGHDHKLDYRPRFLPALPSFLSARPACSQDSTEGDGYFRAQTNFASFFGHWVLTIKNATAMDAGTEPNRNGGNMSKVIHEGASTTCAICYVALIDSPELLVCFFTTH